MFLQIPTFPKYEISTTGEVRNIKSGRMLKPYTQRGYTFVGLSLAGKSRNIGIHRLLLMTFKPQPDLSLHVNHMDSDRSNNNLENIEWCTPSQNASLPKRITNKGIQLYNRGNKRFRIVLKVNGKAKTFGYFRTYEEALESFNKVHIEVHGIPVNGSYSVELLKSNKGAA